VVMFSLVLMHIQYTLLLTEAMFNSDSLLHEFIDINCTNYRSVFYCMSHKVTGGAGLWGPNIMALFFSLKISQTNFGPDVRCD